MGNMRGTAPDSTGRTLRQRYGRAVAVGWWVLSGTILVHLVLSEGMEALQDRIPWLLLNSWLLYALQFRPATTITATALQVTNGVRSHYFPWDSIEEVKVRHSTAVVVGGRVFTRWGAPTAPSGAAQGLRMAREFNTRPYTALPSDERLSVPVRTGDGRSSVLDAWRTYRSTGNREVVNSSWNWPSLIFGAASTVYFITAVFLIH